MTKSSKSKKEKPVSKSIKVNGSISNSVLIAGDKNKVTIKLEHIKTSYGLFTIPQPVVDFIGRNQELNRLKESFLHGALVLGLSGAGGIGKTELARKLAYEIADNYPDAQINIDLQGLSEKPLSPEDAMRRSLEPFYIGQKLPEDKAQLKGLYQQTFGRKKALLLLDNASNAAQVRPLIPPAPSAAIITSRQHFSLTEFGLHTPMRLEVLSDEDAIGLIRSIEPYKANGKEYELARLCRNLPLALRLVASYLHERRDITVTDILDQLNDPTRSLSLTGLEVSLNLSYDNLPLELQKKWEVLSFFPRSFTRDAVYAVWNESRPIAQDNLSELVSLGLVDFDSKNHRYKLHDLVRAFGKKIASTQDDNVIMERFSEYYLSVLYDANYLFTKGRFEEASIILRVEEENIKTGKAWCTQKYHDNEKAASLVSKYLFMGHSVLSILLSDNEFIEWAKNGLEAAQLTNSKELECFYLNQLGFYRRGQLPSEAESFHQHALSLAQKIGNKEFEADALDGLGLDYHSMEKIPLAIIQHKLAIDLARKINYKIREGGATINLGGAYETMGNTKSALKFYEQGVSVLKNLDRPHMFASIGLERIGNIHLVNQRFEDAKKCYLQALETAEKIGSYSRMSEVLGSLNRFSIKIGDRQLSIQYGEEALAVARKSGSPSNEAFCLFNLGRAYSEFNEGDEAIRYFEEALALTRKVGDPTRLASILWYLGFEYRKKSQYHRAIELYTEGLEISQQINNVRLQISLLAVLITAHGFLNNYSLALEYSRQALVLIGKATIGVKNDLRDVITNEIKRLISKK